MTDASPPAGPIAVGIDHVVLFGKVDGQYRGPQPMDPPRQRTDSLFWLRDDQRKDPAVIAHLQKEVAYCKDRTKDLADLSEKIYQEHISHIQETDTTAPYQHGPYMYYTRTVKGLSYKIHCRVKVGKEAGGPEEEILLDENKLAEGKAHCEVRKVSASPDHTLIAYSADFTGDEVFDISFLSNSAGVADVVKGTNGSIVWGNDNSCLFYTTKDEAKRDNQIWRHRVGDADSTNDVSIYKEDDVLFSAFVGKSGDGKTLLVGSGSSETSEIWLLNLLEASSLELVRKREKGVRYSVELHGTDSLYILTNADDCVNNKLVLANRSNPSEWSKVVLPHDPLVHIEEMAIFEKFAVFSGRSGGLTRVWTVSVGGSGCFAFDQHALREVVPSEPVFTIEPVHAHNKEYGALFFRIAYSSMTTPTTWFDVCPFSHNKTTVKVREVGGGFSGSNYVCERRFATAPDGTKIPMSLVRRKDLDMSKAHPAMLYGYGSYGLCVEPQFAISYLPYVDRGMIYVQAHIRGGGEMGRAWFEVGAKYLTKRNTFQDFISCAEDLISSGTTTSDQLACEGRSAGGLLVGAVLNMRPDLFKVALAGVPFVDVMTTMCDPTIPLTTGEWEEWGNPNEYKYFDYMLSYSPVDNVRPQNYPNLFVHAGLHDPRVAYWEPAKWVSKLRQLKTNKDSEIVMMMDMDSGHFSASDRYKYWRDMALQQAFVIKHCLKALR